MTPQAERSEYHDRKPLCHDLAYHIEDGVPVLETNDDER